MTEVPVIVAGSIISAAQIALMARAGAWGFTIGGAVFEGRLPGGRRVADQVRAVLDLSAQVDASRLDAATPPSHAAANDLDVLGRLTSAGHHQPAERPDHEHMEESPCDDL
ncbi:hypothetical protein IMZ11_17880 [Microtetraspora sp. AC03309]|uniref:hypothetical protein n=1 Tax=Microtetraspora sp. AC03309 TaxID=2779376 RepID=UPI001E407D2E|nr:hypothetical protein [Microtetraspora sp. AC03309]MCC5577497.1 hypothetical protein [Microtetraspora sp. AC03309]